MACVTLYPPQCDAKEGHAEKATAFVSNGTNRLQWVPGGYIINPDIAPVTRRLCRYRHKVSGTVLWDGR